MSISTWHPLKTFLLLRPIDPNQDKALYTPESLRGQGQEMARAQECVILSMGPELDRTYETGQHVFVAAYKGAWVEIDGEDLLIVDDATGDVLLVLQQQSTTTTCILCEQGVRVLNTGLHVNGEPCGHNCECGSTAVSTVHASMHPDSHDFTPQTGKGVPA